MDTSLCRYLQWPRWRTSGVALVAAVFFAGPFAGRATAQVYTDWWWNPDTNGQGVNIGNIGNVGFAAWFTYDDSGDGMWLVVGGPFSGSTFSGDLYRTTGPALGTTYDPSKVVGTLVGHASVTFPDPMHATLAWNAYGKSGTLQLVREVYGHATLAPHYATSLQRAATTQCGELSNLIPWADAFTLTETTFQDVQTAGAGYTLTYPGPLAWQGRWVTASGTYTGTTGSYPLNGGNFSMQVLPVENAMLSTALLDSNQVAGCQAGLTEIGVADVAPKTDYNGWWWNPLQSYQGVNVGVQGSIMYVAWYTYDTTGKGMWIVMGGAMTDDHTFSGTFVRTTGNPYAGATGSTNVGTGTLTFSDRYHATLAWSVLGKSGTLALERETYGATDASGSYTSTHGAFTTTSAGAACNDTSGTAPVGTSFTIAQTASTFTLDMTTPYTMHVTGSLTQKGEWLAASGTYTSSDPYGGGTVDAATLVVGSSVLVQLALSPTAHAGCVLTRTLTGAR